MWSNPRIGHCVSIRLDLCILHRTLHNIVLNFIQVCSDPGGPIYESDIVPNFVRVYSDPCGYIYQSDIVPKF